MRAEVFLPNEWLGVDVCAPVPDKTYLVKCKDGYISTGWHTGGENGYWWVYDRNRHENHPNPESAPVLWFAELPTVGIFSGGSHG